MGQHRPHGWSPFLLKYNAIQRQGKNLPPMHLRSGKMWKSNVKIFFHIISHVGLSALSHTTWYSSYCASLKTRQQNGPKLEILQTAIRYMFDYQYFIIMAHMKKKKKKKIRRNKNYVTYRKIIILIQIPWQALILPMIGLYYVKMWK